MEHMSNLEINKIYNEDCLITLDRFNNNQIDAVITSPPYNIIRPNSKDRGYDLYKDGMSNDDYISWTLNIFNKLNEKLNDNGVVLWNISYGTENTTLMSLVIADIIRQNKFTLADIIVWKKQSATPNNVSKNKLTRICEYIYVFCKNKSFDSFNSNKKILKQRDTGQDIYENVFNFITAKNNDEAQDLNKATFSSELVRKLINIYVPKNCLVYDPFMGTGTTALGCVIEGLNYVGSEISENQCIYANERIIKYKSQLKLF